MKEVDIFLEDEQPEEQSRAELLDSIRKKRKEVLKKTGLGSICESFADIVHEYGRRLYKFLMSQCHDSALSQDVMQETFMEAGLEYTGEGCGYEDRGKLWPWLQGIAKRKLCRHFRDLGRHNSVVSTYHYQICEGMGWVNEPPQVFDYKTREELRDEHIAANFQSMISTGFDWMDLTPCERRILELRFMEGMHFKEISEEIGEPKSTVMSRFYASLQKVYKQLCRLENMGLLSRNIRPRDVKRIINDYFMRNERQKVMRSFYEPLNRDGGNGEKPENGKSRKYRFDPSGKC